MTSRPATRPIPVTIPAPGASPSYIPCAASGESSRNGEPGSRRASIRSRTNIFFCSAWRSRPDPPCRAFAISALSSVTRASAAAARSRNSAEAVSTFDSRTSISPRDGFAGPSTPHPFRGFLPDEVDERLRRSSRQEDLADSERLQRRDVLVRDDSAGEHDDVGAPLLLQEVDDLREEHVVGAREDRESDDVHV